MFYKSWTFLSKYNFPNRLCAAAMSHSADVFLSNRNEKYAFSLFCFFNSLSCFKVDKAVVQLPLVISFMHTGTIRILFVLSLLN